MFGFFKRKSSKIETSWDEPIIIPKENDICNEYYQRLIETDKDSILVFSLNKSFIKIRFKGTLDIITFYSQCELKDSSINFWNGLFKNEKVFWFRNPPWFITIYSEDKNIDIKISNHILKEKFYSALVTKFPEYDDINYKEFTRHDYDDI